MLQTYNQSKLNHELGISSGEGLSDWGILQIISEKKLELKDAQAEHFAKKPKQLEQLWLKFQTDYFGLSTEHQDTELLQFNHQIIEWFKQKFPQRAFSISAKNTNNAKKLSALINNKITQEEQAQFWRTRCLLNSKFGQELINEQKYKFGTNDFLHNSIPRVITEQVREDYVQAIQDYKVNGQNQFKEAGFSFQGLGFGGAAFLVTDSCPPQRVEIPPYVLKIPTANCLQSQKEEVRFADLEDEFHALQKETALFLKGKNKSLTQLEQTKETIKLEDRLSQRLAIYRIEGAQISSTESNKGYFYLGQRQDKKNPIPILASVCHEGKNIYETARALNTQYYKEQPTRKHDQMQHLLNGFITKGLSDNAVLEMMKWYLIRAEAGINFYDLFPHNMLYIEEGEEPRFLDYASLKPDPRAKGILAARQEYPVDTLVFDLLTFLLMHEQRHPYLIELRRSARITTKIQALSKPENITLFNKLYQTGICKEEIVKAMEGKAEEAYQTHLNSKFEQLQNCLGKATQQGLFSLDQLIESLERLNSYEKFPEVYIDLKKEVNHLTHLNKDFSRLQPAKGERRGPVFLKELLDHFKAIQAA